MSSSFGLFLNPTLHSKIKVFIPFNPQCFLIEVGVQGKKESYQWKITLRYHKLTAIYL